MSDMTDRAPVPADPSASSRAQADPFACWRGRHHPRARQALIDEFIPVVRELAGRYRHPTEPLNGLVHLAVVGLLDAIDRFDPELGVPFSSVAARSIVTHLNRHARGHRRACPSGLALDHRRAAPTPPRYRSGMFS